MLMVWNEKKKGCPFINKVDLKKQHVVKINN